MTVTLAVVLVNAVASLAACAFNAAAYARTHRTVNMMIAALAGGYFCSYVWLVFNPEQRLEWSQVMAGFSVLVWPLVWCWPAWCAMRTHRRLVSVARRLGEVAGE